MENERNREGRVDQASQNKESQSQPRQNGSPQSLEGMNFEQQRGTYKNSDYGGAMKNTRSGRNSSDVSQDELK